MLEEQARGATERPAWLLDAYDRLGLVEKYITRLRSATQWRERAFAAELLGRVGNAQAVPALLETVAATRTEDADVREIALRALARIGDPRAVGPLVEALKHSEVWLVPRIADILTRHGALAIDPMIAFLGDPARHPARAWAASILGEVGAARAFPALVRALGDLDDEVRAKSASALGRIGDGRAVGYLLDHLLSDPAPFVRARIAQALGQFDQPEVIERLVRALGDPAWWVRMRSVEALEQVGAQAEGPLLLALDDPDPEIRIRAAVALERLDVPARLIADIEGGEHAREAVQTLTRFGNAGARELLAEGLAHPSAAVRAAMLEAISRAGRRDLGAELNHVAGADAEPGLRAAAFDALRTLGITEGIPTALEHLNDADQRVRTAAMHFVGQLGGPELADRIRPRTNDPDPAVRAATALALGLTQARGAGPDFIRLLTDPDPTVRAAAARGAADANAREAAPALLGLLTDVAPTVQREAVLALGRLGDASTAAVLLKHLSGGGPDLRGAIATAVTRLDPDRITELLDRLVETGDSESKLAVVRTVSQLRASNGAALLAVLWRDPDPAVRTATAEALGRLGGTEAVRLLVRGLSDPDDDVRAHAVDALARSNGLEAGPALLGLLAADPTDRVRERAALATGLLRTPGGEAALLAASQPGASAEVRAASLLALGGYEQESMVGRLVEMADDRALRDLLADRIRHDAGFRLLAQRLGASRHVELQALGGHHARGDGNLARRGAARVRSNRPSACGSSAASGPSRATAAATPSCRWSAAIPTPVSGPPRSRPSPGWWTRRNSNAPRCAHCPTRRRRPSHGGGALRPPLPGARAAEPDQAAPPGRRGHGRPPGGGGAGRGELRHLRGPDAGPRRGRSRDGDRLEGGQAHPASAAADAAAPHGGEPTPEVREALARLWGERPDLIDAALLARLAQDPVVAVRVAVAAACAVGGRTDGLAALGADPAAEVRAMTAVASLLLGTGRAPEGPLPRSTRQRGRGAAGGVAPRPGDRSIAGAPSRRRGAARPPRRPRRGPDGRRRSRPARARRRRRRAPGGLMQASILAGLIVIAHRGAAHLPRLLPALQQLHAPPDRPLGQAGPAQGGRPLRRGPRPDRRQRLDQAAHDDRARVQRGGHHRGLGDEPRALRLPAVRGDRRQRRLDGPHARGAEAGVPPPAHRPALPRGHRHGAGPRALRGHRRRCRGACSG